MIPLRRGKMLQARAAGGQFRKWTGDDFGVGACPNCNGFVTQPPQPESLKSGMVDPLEFNRWRRARVCGSCGWTNQ